MLRRFRIRTHSFGGAVLVLGLLLWARLLLLTGHPKMAMAEPGATNAQAVERPQAGPGGVAPPAMSPAKRAAADLRAPTPDPAPTEATHSASTGD